VLAANQSFTVPAEHWKECCDADGCIQHTVDLDCDTAQEVLDALQAAVFTSKLPEECSWQVGICRHIMQQHSHQHDACL
jgi:hypothetical protein